jgi:hypothetical protein
LIARALLASVAPMTFVIWTGVVGLDFGFHWDEDAMFQQVQRAATWPGTLLPGRYHYGSVSFWLMLSAAAPDAIGVLRTPGREPAGAAIRALTTTDTYRLRARGVFLVVTAIGVATTAALALALGSGIVEAALAAALIATSWEVGYHARWVAPDGVVMTFAALSLAAAVGALTAPAASSDRWLRIAAIAAGGALGTKYSAWPLLVTIAMSAWMSARDHSRSQMRRLALLLALAGGAFLITTPGAVLQPIVFAKGVWLEVAHYATEHGRHTVEAGPGHLWRMLVYTGGVLLSPYAVLAIAWTALAIAGAVDAWRRSRRQTIVLLAFPAVYLLEFTPQHVMIVRNLLVLAPVVAVLAARGAGAVWAWTSQPSFRAPRRAALAAATGLAIAANVTFDVVAAQSIRHRRDRTAASEFSAWRRSHPTTAVTVSPRVESDVPVTNAAGMVDGPAAPTMIAFYLSEHDVQANQFGIFEDVFGPRDANPEYYTDWAGSEHIVTLRSSTASRLGLHVR